MMKPMLGLSLHESIPICVQLAGWAWASVDAAINFSVKSRNARRVDPSRYRVMSIPCLALKAGGYSERISVPGRWPRYAATPEMSDYLPPPVAPRSTAWRARSMLSDPPTWLGGYSLNVCRKPPTRVTAGTIVQSFSPHQRPYSID